MILLNWLYRKFMSYDPNKYKSIVSGPSVGEIAESLREQASDSRDALNTSSEIPPVYPKPVFADEKPQLASQEVSNSNIFPDTLIGASSMVKALIESASDKLVNAMLASKDIAGADHAVVPDPATRIISREAETVLPDDDRWNDDFGDEGLDGEPTMVRPLAAEPTRQRNPRHEAYRKIDSPRRSGIKPEQPRNGRHTGRRVLAIGAVLAAASVGAAVAHDAGNNEATSSSGTSAALNSSKNKASTSSEAIKQQTITETTSQTITVGPTPVVIKASRRSVVSENPPAGNLNLEKYRIDQIDKSFSKKHKAQSTTSPASTVATTTSAAGTAPVASPKLTETVPAKPAPIKTKSKAHATGKSGGAAVKTSVSSNGGGGLKNKVGRTGAAGLSN
jgi:hypothetical protein